MKRSRAPNFNNREIMHLLLLVEKYPIIENKKTDAATSKEKIEAWREITQEYNASTSGVHRTLENLVACYKNQKVKVRKEHSSEKMEIKVCAKDESPPQPPSTTMHEYVKSLMGPNLEGLLKVELREQQQERDPSENRNGLPEQIIPSDEETQKPDRSTKSIKPKCFIQNRGKGTRSTSSSFKELAEDRKELIKLKKQLAVNQLRYQQELHEINLEIAKENLNFTRMKNELELKILKKKHEVWIRENLKSEPET